MVEQGLCDERRQTALTSWIKMMSTRRSFLKLATFSLSEFNMAFDLNMSVFIAY